MNGMHRRALVGAVILVLVSGTAGLLAAPTASANVRLEGGETPFYARISSSAIFHTDAWAVIAFYRPPACVPAGFNLLAFFDVPGAFACGPTTIDGFTIWPKGSQSDPAPIQAEFHGLGAVPVWFVSWPELEAAVADEVLTIGELAALPSLLVGSASFYQETLHPVQAAQVGELEFVARGTLEDGRPFAAHAVATYAGGHRFPHVRIVFGEL
jgi:hypothetical protein